MSMVSLDAFMWSSVDPHLPSCTGSMAVPQEQRQPGPKSLLLCLAATFCFFFPEKIEV